MRQFFEHKSSSRNISHLIFTYKLSVVWISNKPGNGKAKLERAVLRRARTSCTSLRRVAPSTSSFTYSGKLKLWIVNFCSYKIQISQIVSDYIRDYVRILIPRGLLLMDCLFLLLFSFLNPQIPEGLKPLQPPL